tara:strand:+ start:5943 stop:6668 length:726 start_codon:yes stop_codon:yes gene_type:complete
MSLSVDKIFHPDGKHLGSMFAGMSGSGKTTAALSLLQEATKHPKFKEFHRFVIIDPKRQPGDWDILTDPITDMKKAMKSIRKERVTLFWPSMEFIEQEVSFLADYIFQLADTEPKSSYTFILDESSILITATQIPLSLKRLSVQGRAKRIMPIWITQRPLVNRWTDANLSNMFLFRTLPVDADQLSKRWGLDFEENMSIIRQKDYSFAWFDLEKANIKHLEPVKLPKKRRRKPKPWYRRII